MGVKRWYFLAKVVKKFCFAYLLLPFPRALGVGEGEIFCIIFLHFEDTFLLELDNFLRETCMWLYTEPLKKERWMENSFSITAAANDLSQVAWSDN